MIFPEFSCLFLLGQVKVFWLSPNITRKPSLLSQKSDYSLRLLKATLRNILKIKNAFPKLPFGKIIIKISNVIYNNRVIIKLKINITTKKSFRKHIIISISKINSKTIVSQANVHVLNINRLLKAIKSEVLADFIYFW